jgi:hypothetical protein
LRPAPRLLRGSNFVDTSAFFALADRTDRFHSLAIQFVKSNENLLVTSNLVVQETITLIRMRLGHDPAVKFGRRLLNEKVTPAIRVTADDERKAWETFRRFRDKRFSFVDCTSFALMGRLGISAAFAFDHDFRQFGEWVVYPQLD